MAVLAPESSRFLDLARDVAADRDESVVHAIDRLPAGEPVVYVDAPDSVDEETLLALQRRHLSGDATDDAFGIVTGHTEAAARDLYFADHEYDGGHLVLSKNRDLSFRDADVTVLAGDDLTAHAVSERMGGGSRSLSILVPGWPIHIYFEDGLLCGFPARCSTTEPPSFWFARPATGAATRGTTRRCARTATFGSCCTRTGRSSRPPSPSNWWTSARLPRTSRCSARASTTASGWSCSTS
jgi:hypothetical protein